MQDAIQLTFLDEAMPTPAIDDWTFNGASTREMTHVYHDYPARMIPQIAAKLIAQFGDKARLLFDPYCGSGTSLVEGKLHGLDVVGTDLNPLARLIAKAKLCMPDVDLLNLKIRELQQIAVSPFVPSSHTPTVIKGITRLDFWFKPAVIEKLYRLKTFIDAIDDEPIRLFFQTAFSETVRECSNTRTGEFKLYRYTHEQLAAFNPDVFQIMSQKLLRNRAGLHHFIAALKKLPRKTTAFVHSFNSVHGIPENMVGLDSVDLVVTSPPYGDSHTTVAYGQYSRLSAAWLGLDDPDKIDRKLMGGAVHKKPAPLACERLNLEIEKISQTDEKRALEVAAFYHDLSASVHHVAKAIRRRGYACYVVGNRKVKGVTLSTDIAVQNFFERCGFVHHRTFIRSIPNKRMPSKNSPSNQPGQLDDTMTKEYIVVMQRAE